MLFILFLEFTSQVNGDQMNKILELIESGKKEGAKLECGGSRHGTKGFFVQPTVFSNVTDNMRIAREEIFGPVMQIMKFKTLDEAIQRCNNSEFGLYAGVLTNDLNRAIMFSQGVRAGTVAYVLFLSICLSVCCTSLFLCPCVVMYMYRSVCLSPVYVDVCMAIYSVIYTIWTKVTGN